MMDNEENKKRPDPARKAVTTGLLIWLGLGAVHCARPDASRTENTEERLIAIEKQIEQGNLRLEAVRRTLAEEQTRLEESRLEADYQLCRAGVAEHRAEVERRRSECAREIAGYHFCLAKNSKEKADTGIGGCLFGIIAATASGGAAAPWALGGCSAGLAVGAALASDCPVPECSTSLENVDQAVLAARGLTSVPRCGGWLGVELSLAVEQTAGVRVNRVGPTTFAANVGLVAGDVIVELQGHPITKIADLEPVLEQVLVGSFLRVSMIRGERRLSLGGRASNRDAQGKLAQRAMLGVEIVNETRVRFRRGVTVDEVADASPAAHVLLPGDQISGVKVQATVQRPEKVVAVNTPADLDAAIDEVRAGEEILLNIIRVGRQQTLSLRLGKRAEGLGR
jgi:S1-C subfamily serine protease